MSPSEVAERLLNAGDAVAKIAREHADKLERPYAPGKWTGHQVVSHLADADVVYLGRFFMAIAQPGGTIQPFNQDLWVKELKEHQRPLEISVALMQSTRAAFAHTLRSFSFDELQRRSVHPERGELPALLMAQLMVQHAEHHLTQLEAVVAGRTWTKTGVWE